MGGPSEAPGEPGGCLVRPRDWPRSPTAGWINAAGVVSLFVGVLALRKRPAALEWRVPLVLAIPAVTIIALEAVFLRPQQRRSTGLQLTQRWAPSPRVVALKLLGFHTLLAAMALAYYVAGEYHKPMYSGFWRMVRAVGPLAYLLCLTNFVVVDGYQREQDKQADRYHQLGRLVAGWVARRPLPGQPVDSSGLRQLWLEYLVKFFFLPLMGTFATNAVVGFESGILRTYGGITSGKIGFVPVYSFMFDTLMFVDVTFATIGYSLACKGLDSHVRSVEPTALGWAVAVICYKPFADGVLSAYLPSVPQWGWVKYLDALGAPHWLRWLWGFAILGLMSFYTLATICFGVRFSNITNRGIIASGPYEWTRHPAYVSKNTAWWLIRCPWSTHRGFWPAVLACVRLGLVNYVYYMRAMTEEAHLLQDPAYQAYYNAVQQLWGLPTLEQQAQRRQQRQGDAAAPAEGGGRAAAPWQREREPLLHAPNGAPAAVGVPVSRVLAAGTNNRA